MQGKRNPGETVGGTRVYQRAAAAAAAAAATKSLQSCPTLCDPIDGSLPGSSIPGILQVRILEWIAFPFSRGSSQPRDQTQVSRISYDKSAAAAKSLQSCPTLCDPIDGSPPGSPVPGILQARTLVTLDVCYL